MRFSFSLLLALGLSSAPVLAQTQNSFALGRPDANVEARTARELNAIVPTILNGHRGRASNADKEALALAFANLGRVEAAIRVANTIEPENDSNDSPTESAAYIRDQVREIGVRRSALLGHIEGARATAAEIEAPRLHAKALLSIARRQIAVGDVGGAQRTLFQALPLVERYPQVQIYIAVLLNRANDSSAAKRLLDRVESALPIVDTSTPSPQAAVQVRGTDEDRAYLAWALFETGQIEKSTQIKQGSANFFPFNLMGAFILAGDFDLAEKQARQINDEQNQLKSLESIAWALHPTQPERALTLAQEIRERLQKSPIMPAVPKGNDEIPSLRDTNLTVLAAFYHQTGHEDEATTLLKEISERSTPTTASNVRFFYALAPFLYDRGVADIEVNRIRYRRKPIERISKDVNAALPSTNFVPFGTLLYFFTQAQIQSGAVDAARQTLQLLEDQSLDPAKIRTNPEAYAHYRLNSALQIAQSWQKLGETKHVSEFLNRIWNSPLAHDMKPSDRAQQFISYGFVDEGKRRLVALGLKPEEPLNAYWSLAYCEAQYKPHVFPAWLQNVRDPHKKLVALSDFSRGLTESLLQDSGASWSRVDPGDSIYSMLS